MKTILNFPNSNTTKLKSNAVNNFTDHSATAIWIVIHLFYIDFVLLLIKSAMDKRMFIDLHIVFNPNLLNYGCFV